ncbi:MAG: adenosylmethionine decarboxylase [Bacteroidota bacterium]|jgi:S-adenosylmethionine decarboxylase
MTYQPGLHIIAELFVPNTHLLNQYTGAKACIDALIQQYALQNLGEVYHNFTPAGFTAVVCLSESHISLHSWPEHQRLHLDVYLSNFLKDNSTTTQEIFNRLVDFFDASIINQQILKR